MKKTVLLLSVLLAMLSWYPFLVIAGWKRDFSVTVRYPVMTFLILTLCFCAISLRLLLVKEKPLNGAICVLSCLLAPVSIAHLLVWVWENRNFWIFVLALVWVTFAMILLCAYGRQRFVQGVLVGSSAVILLPFMLLCLLLFLFPFGRITVVRTVLSPEGNYCAQLINDDQGALGGNTLVEVHDTRKNLDLFLLSVQKNPRRVYTGRWGEFETMKLEWESEEILLINDRPYKIH